MSYFQAVGNRFAETMERFFSHPSVKNLIYSLMTSSHRASAQEKSGEYFVGRSNSKYLIERQIGQGGLSYVFQAKDLEKQRTVALKLLKPKRYKNNDILNKSIHEATVLFRLNHPDIIKVYDQGRDYFGLLRSHYIAMEFFPGVDLDTIISQGLSKEIPLDEKIMTLLGITCAVKHAHEKGIIHGDLKPGNVLVSEKGNKLIDWSLSHYVNGQGKNPPNKTGICYGTPGFMAPETITNRKIGTYTDVFSLGLLYFCWLGDKVSAFKTTERINPLILLNIYQQDLEPRVDLLPSETRDLVRAMINHRPINRPGVNEVIQGLEKILEKK